MDIYIMGYMGSGKSTVGQLLATHLGYDFVDYDEYISKKEGMTISELFDKKGEIYFRKKEAEYLKEILETTSSKKIVALGGGTPCYGSNLNTIKESGVTSVSYTHLTLPTILLV